jgi:tetratricopeptide (TPR) repeat protein
MDIPRSLRALCLSALLVILWDRASTAAENQAAHADSLYRRGLARWARATLDSRRMALADLERATLLAPRREDVWLSLGTCCIESGRFARGRSCLSRAARLAPASFDAWFQLGSAWKHDWLSSLERSSLDEATRCFIKACVAAPNRFEGWTAAAALELLRGHSEEACTAALHAHHIAPGEPQPITLLGSALFRLGRLALADSAFRVAREMSPPVGGSLEGAVASLTTSEDASSLASPPMFDWTNSDPDFTTPENEAQLDYLSRLTLARFLFRDGERERWDKRAELFVRYGPPASIDYNSAGAQLESNELDYRFPRHSYVRYAPDPIPFPYNAQTWRYPELGIEVTLWDRSLSQSFQLPYSNEAEPDPRPNPELLASRADLAAIEGGKAVFRAMSPGAQPMVIEGTASRFPLANGFHLLGHVFADGAPVDSTWGAWALVSEDGRVLSRGARALSPSACDPAARQVAEFAADVAPGDYRLDLSTRASQGRQGIVHLHVHVAPLPTRLAMSDLVLLCGEPATYVGPEGVRIEPNPGGEVGPSRNLTAYYELDRLATDASGNARFAYTYSVHALRSRRKSGHEAAALEATREEDNVGQHRRQFVSVPIGSLAPGPYELRIEVRDLLAGTTTNGTVSFVKTKAR